MFWARMITTSAPCEIRFSTLLVCGLFRRPGVVRDVLAAALLDGCLDGGLVPLCPSLFLVVVPRHADGATLGRSAGCCRRGGRSPRRAEAVRAVVRSVVAPPPLHAAETSSTAGRITAARRVKRIRSVPPPKPGRNISVSFRATSSVHLRSAPTGSPSVDLVPLVSATQSTYGPRFVTRPMA